MYRDAAGRNNDAAALWALAVGVTSPAGAVVGLFYTVTGRDYPPPDPEEYGSRE